MPAPVVPWVTGTPVSAKSLDLALYTADGTADNPNGIAFHAQRPILAEAYSRTATFPGASGGTQSVMSTSGSVSTSFMVIDTAGYFGQSQDQPGAGYYQFQPVINGSAGDGATAGGWTLLSHFAPLKPTATQTSVSADLTGQSQTPVSGTRQAPSGTLDSCPFFLDLVDTGATIAWQPAVTIRDSAGTTTTNAVNATDPSGETPRFYAVWAAASATTTGQAVFPANGAYPWTAPAGVSSVTVTGFGAGGGGGGGDASGGGIEYGGGGGGGAEYAQGVIGVTGGNNYTVVVGAGGAGGTGGTAPTLASAGGNSVFAGDTANVTAHGGGAGGVASSSADGTGGSGGSGSGATTHHSGGNGAAGGTAAYGGGGGSSAGPAVAGNNAMGATGAAAPSGGGPGGSGGSVAISVVQTKSGTTTGSNTNGYALNFKNAVQAGNTVVAAYNYQGKPSAVNGNFPDPTITLSDGTVSGGNITADNTSISTNMQSGVNYFFSASGGQTGIVFTGHASTSQGDFRAVCIQMWEVTGLGSSPSLDAQGQGTTTMGGSGDIKFYPPSGTSVPNSNDAPEFWVGLGAGQQNTSFTTYAPASSEGWTCFPANTVTKSGITSSLLSGYQVATTTGPVKYSAGTSKGGGFSKAVSVGWVVATFTTSSVTNGATPITGPGGGGGGGLGTSGNGGTGFDGSVTLTWTGVSGGSYGNPPLPAPFSGWTDDTTVGVTATADVNLNSTAGIQPVCNFLSSPPILRVTTTSAQPIASSASGGVIVSFTGTASTVTVDSYSGWIIPNYGPPVRALAGPVQAKAPSGRGIGGHAGGGKRRAVRAALPGRLKGGASTSTPAQRLFNPPPPGVPYYVVQRTGLYLFHGLVAFASNSSGRRQCGAVINGVTYWGPPANPASSGTTNVAKTQVFSLQAGDIVQLCAFQTAGSPLALSATDQTRFLLVFLCEEGSPASIWSPPDITFRWTSGMSPAQLPGLLQTHLGNDLGFLVNRPYLLAYQTVAQSGLSVGAFSTVTMDTVGGIVHTGDVGDNYNGWSSGASNAYVAPVAGWWLVVEEVFATAAGAATATVTAGILPSTSGGVTPSVTPDYYQAQTATTAATFGGGAAAVTLQYCLAGESVTPQLQGAGYASPYGTLVGTANGGTRTSHLEICWLSE